MNTDIPLVDSDDTTKGRRSDPAKAANPTLKMVAKNMLREQAEIFKRDLAAKTIMEDGNKQIWVFMNGIYEPYGESIIRTLLNEHNYEQKDINKCLKITRAICSIRRKEFQIDLSRTFTFVNLDNCVRNWKTEETFEHDSKYVFKYKFPVEYDPDADCPLFKEMTENMFKTPEDLKEFKKWCGYYAMNSSHYQKALFVVGPAGSSKGTAFRIIAKVIGEENCSAATLKDLCAANLYSAADIEHKLANLCGDLATSKLTGAELSTYYKITGEDLVHGRVIRHMPINFRPRSKLAWAFNKLPMMSMNVFTANEFWRRCIIIETKLYEYTDDPAFEDKLGQEIPGIYNHFFEEGVRLLVEEGFNEFKKDNYKELKNKWISHMRTASDEEIIKDPAKISFVLNAEDVKEPLTDVTGLGIGKNKE